MNFIIKVRRGFLWRTYRCNSYQVESRLCLQTSDGISYTSDIRPWLILRLTSGKMRIISNIDEKDWMVDDGPFRARQERHAKAVWAPAAASEKVFAQAIFE